jgi:competence protein ComEA
VALVGLTAGLLLVSGFGLLRWGTRPTDLERGAGFAYRIDLNQASRAELRQLPGVGNGLAERIERYRDRRGGFRSVDELLQVDGIGPATLERLRPWVCVGTEEDEDNEPAMPATRPAHKRDTDKAGHGAKRSLAGKRAVALRGAVIDVNRASAEELRKLPGIGPKLSQRIVDARGRQPFRSVDDLRRVRGIGPKILEGLRPYATAGGPPVHVVKSAEKR